MLTAISRSRMQLEGASREAEGYLELGMHDQALRSLQRRGKLVHGDGHACYLMGECLREMRRYHEAIYPLRRSVELDPKPCESWLALGWCYKRTGRLDEAIRALQRAGDFAPDQALVQYNLACYHSLAGERMAALRRLKRALDLDRSLAALVADEPDFDAMRADPALRMLLAAPR
ncbi:tetratricopeptide repeat protein [Botrimarina sp.]|uniref:TPR end-of-group domain-containing protein n=1 Tax=Botrimarina sp. TaxID=2795802 RepID=UPI0032EC82AA